MEELTTVATHRRVAVEKLGTLVRGGLDWIVMNALEKDLTRRYESASSFVIYIQRSLDHGPVLPAAPNALYRFQKFARRNRTALATAASLAALLMAGAGVSIWQAVRASRAERHARTEATRSRQVATFLQEMLNGVRPSVALGRDRT